MGRRTGRQDKLFCLSFPKGKSNGVEKDLFFKKANKAVSPRAALFLAGATHAFGAPVLEAVSSQHPGQRRPPLPELRTLPTCQSLSSSAEGLQHTQPRNGFQGNCPGPLGEPGSGGPCPRPCLFFLRPVDPTFKKERGL